MTNQDSAGAGREYSANRIFILLSVMMFLQWAVPGLSAPILPKYLSTAAGEGGLGFTGTQVGMLYGLAAAIGAILAPFIAGQVADRYLNADRAMAILLVFVGIVQILLAGTTGFAMFFVLFMASSIVFAPTASLTNSISFHNLTEKERRFGLVRLWGTIGWVVASGLFCNIWLNTDSRVENVHRIADSLRVAGVLAVAYAAYCLLLLPKTPPNRDVADPLAFARAFKLFLHPGFLVVSIVAVPIAMVHACYFMRISPYLTQEIGIPEKYLGWTIGLGQAAEVVFLALLAIFLKRLGYRGVLALGAASYALRYTIFAVGEPHWLVVAAQGLHGLCFGCFYAGAFLYVERVAAADIRHSAQTVFNLVLTMGGVVASFYNGFFDRFTKLGKDLKPVQDYTQFWWACAAVSVVATFVLLMAFPRKEAAASAATLPA